MACRLVGPMADLPALRVLGPIRPAGASRGRSDMSAAMLTVAETPLERDDDFAFVAVEVMA